jgi:cell division protein FtsL
MEKVTLMTGNCSAATKSTTQPQPHAQNFGIENIIIIIATLAVIIVIVIIIIIYTKVLGSRNLF